MLHDPFFLLIRDLFFHFSGRLTRDVDSLDKEEAVDHFLNGGFGMGHTLQ